MKQRVLGRDGPQPPPLGLGCLGVSELYGSADEGEATRTLHR